MRDPAADAASGALAEGSVPKLLRGIYLGRRNGWLRLVRGEERQSLRFRRGHIVNAHTNVVQERLGEMMVRRGTLSAAALARATEIVIREKRRLGEVLRELGLADASMLEDMVALHVHEMLSKVFSWTEGSYSFEPEEDAPGGELTLKLSTGELILEAVRAIRDPKVVHESLGETDRVLEPSSDPLLRFQKLTLSPADGFVMSRVDGTTSAREIVQMIPLPTEDTEKSLLGLLSTGVIEYSPERRRAGSAAGDSLVRGRPASGPVPPRSSAAAPPAPQAPVPAPPPAPRASAAPAPASATPAASADERRREILEMAEALQSKNHFQILAIPETATELEVKEAFFRLAKRFHPDVHHDSSLGDLRDTLETLFIRLGEVYEVLKDPRRRAEYEERLQRARTPTVRLPAVAALPAQVRPEPEPVTAPSDDPVDPREAERAFQSADALFEQEKYWDAIQLLEPIAHSVHGGIRSRACILLARCYLKNPKWARRAEEVLLEVTREEPKAADAWVLLGGIYDEKGMRARALSMFRKALEGKPDLEDALKYVASHGPEEPAPSEQTGGLFRRLFRKP